MIIEVDVKWLKTISPLGKTRDEVDTIYTSYPRGQEDVAVKKFLENRYHTNFFQDEDYEIAEKRYVNAKEKKCKVKTEKSN